VTAMSPAHLPRDLVPRHGPGPGPGSVPA
jgi:hypothetical protein